MPCKQNFSVTSGPRVIMVNTTRLENGTNTVPKVLFLGFATKILPLALEV